MRIAPERSRIGAGLPGVRSRCREQAVPGRMKITHLPVAQRLVLHPGSCAQRGPPRRPGSGRGRRRPRRTRLAMCAPTKRSLVRLHEAVAGTISATRNPARPITGTYVVLRMEAEVFAVAVGGHLSPAAASGCGSSPWWSISGIAQRFRDHAPPTARAAADRPASYPVAVRPISTIPTFFHTFAATAPAARPGARCVRPRAPRATPPREAMHGKAAARWKRAGSAAAAVAPSAVRRFRMSMAGKSGIVDVDRRQAQKPSARLIAGTPTAWCCACVRVDLAHAREVAYGVYPARQPPAMDRSPRPAGPDARNNHPAKQGGAAEWSMHGTPAH